MALSPYFMPTDAGDNAFTVEAPKIKFGAGALAEIGQDAAALCMTRIAVFTDRVVKDLPALATVTGALQRAGLNFQVYTEMAVEPTERSFKAAAVFARP